MAQVPIWLRGRNLTSVLITFFVADASGNLSAYTGVTGNQVNSVSGYVDAVRFRSTPAQEMIQSVDQGNANYEILYEDFTMELTEILTAETSFRQPVLPSGYAFNNTFVFSGAAPQGNVTIGFDFWELIFARGGQAWGMVGKRGEYEDGVTAFGKNVVRQTLRPIGISPSFNPAGTLSP